MSLDKLVYLYNDGDEPFEGRWDSVDYSIKDEPLTIKLGVAEHWKAVHPDAQLRVEEIPQEEIEKLTPSNPLVANDRGEAFAAIKKTQGKKQSDKK